MRTRLLLFFSSSSEYQEDTVEYTVKDVILGLLYYILVLLSYILMAHVFIKHKASTGTLTETYVFCITGIFAVCTIAFVLLLCRLRHQSLRSIGLSVYGSWPSIRCGLRSGLAVAAVFIAIAIVFHYRFILEPQLFTMRFVYYLIFIAFEEELIFRAFLGPRLYGVMRHKWLAVVVTGVLFSLLHIPFQLVLSQKTLVDFLAGSWSNLLFTFGFHFVLQLQYARYNRIYAPVIFHFLWDFTLWFAMNPVL